MILSKLPSPWLIDQFVASYLSRRDELIKQSVPEVDFIENILKLTPGSKILDIGCGEGRHSIELARRGYIVKGIDISPILIEAAKSRAKKLGVPVKFEVANINDFHADESYDAILLIFGVLGDSGDVQDDINMLKKSYSLLKPGGKILALFSNAMKQLLHKNPDFDIENAVVTNRVSIGENQIEIERPFKLYFPSEAKSIMKCCGFDIISVYGDPFVGEKHQEKPFHPDDREFLIFAEKPEN